MFSTYESTPRRIIGAFAAVAIVAPAGLGLDQAHLSAAPAGIVTVGELTPVGIERMAQVTLPEIVITVARPDATARHFAASAKSRGPGITATSSGAGR